MIERMNINIINITVIVTILVTLLVGYIIYLMIK
mgnify:CR=1 FL=1